MPLPGGVPIHGQVTDLCAWVFPTLQSEKGSRPSCHNQERRRGSDEVVPGTSVFPCHLRMEQLLKRLFPHNERLRVRRPWWPGHALTSISFAFSSSICWRSTSACPSTWQNCMKLDDFQIGNGRGTPGRHQRENKSAWLLLTIFYFYFLAS